MGCDIHSFAEVKRKGKWEVVGDVFPLHDFNREYQKKTHGSNPFNWRAYGMYGFLADVRNYSHVPVIAQPKYAIPDDSSDLVKEKFEDWRGNAHTATWLTARQLLEFNYDQTFWDRRVTKQTGPNSWNGAALAEEGEGEYLTVREFLGEQFFSDLNILKSLGNPEDVRVVFWFDN